MSVKRTFFSQQYLDTQWPTRVQRGKWRGLQYETEGHNILTAWAEELIVTRRSYVFSHRGYNTLKVNIPGHPNACKQWDSVSLCGHSISEGMRVVMSVWRYGARRVSQSVTTAQEGEQWAAHSLEKALCWQGARVSPCKWSSADRGHAYCCGGWGHSQINATDFRHVWLTGMELNISALCADVDTTVDSSCLSPHNHKSYENLKESLGFITFSKTDYCRGPLSAPCTFCFWNLRTAPPMTTSLKHPDESISLPSYGDTLFNSEK